MQKLTSDDPETKSADVVADNLDALQDLFPDAFTEGRIDFDVLKQLLGGAVDDRDEKYGLNWHGKRQARQRALTPSSGTLRPCLEESVDWDETQNLMIEGDNLEVLKLLKKSYANKVKLIYIDPPYNTGKDRIYADTFSETTPAYLAGTDQQRNSMSLTSNPETSGRFHTNWLNMMEPRLKLACSLLSTDGVLFVSIDANELSNLRLVLDDLFGTENYIGCITWKNVTDNNPSRIASENEYILSYGKRIRDLKPVWRSGRSAIRELLVEVGSELIESNRDDAVLASAYQSWYRAHKAELGPLSDYKFIDRHGIYAGSRSVHNPGKEGYRYDVVHPGTGKPCLQPLMGYRFPPSTMETLLAEDRVIFGPDETKLIELKIYATDYSDKLSSVYVLDGRRGPNEVKALMGNIPNVFANPKPVELLEDLISYAGVKEGVVLDFFAGSGTTAQAVMQLNQSDGGQRSFILVQLDEKLDEADPKQAGALEVCDEIGCDRTISALTRERLRRAGTAIGGSSDLRGD